MPSQPTSKSSNESAKTSTSMKKGNQLTQEEARMKVQTNQGKRQHEPSFEQWWHT
jgi:hypothetical protein